MAPRDVLKGTDPGPTGKRRQRLDGGRSDDRSDCDGDNDGDSYDGETPEEERVITKPPPQGGCPPGWRRRILLHLQGVMRSMDDAAAAEGPSSDSRRRFRYRGAAAGTILAVAAFLVYRYGPTRRRRLSLQLLLSLLSPSLSSGSGSSSPVRDASTAEDASSGLAVVDGREPRLWRFLCSALSAGGGLLFRRPDHASARDASLGMLRSAARGGVVRRALVGPTAVVFATTGGGDGGGGCWNRTALPTAEMRTEIVALLAENGCGDISALPESLGSRLAGPALAALPFVYLALVYRILKNLHGGGIDDGPGGGNFFLTKLLGGASTGGGGSGQAVPRTRFSDVAGLDLILPEVQEIVSYLQHPGGYRALGAEPPRGVLLHGPPGAGKTLMAQAVAGEADCDAFVACSGSDFCELYVGRGASRVRSLFREARAVARQRHRARTTGGGGGGWRRYLGGSWDGTDAAQNDRLSETQRPATAIIFIDELDALAKDRSHGGMMNSNDERDQTLNQLLTEMDGFFDHDGVAVIVIAATNRAQVLDPAILRRFDRQIFVPYPDAPGRNAILKIHAAKTRCRFSTVNWEFLADQTANFSGSDLKQVVNDAALLAVRQKSDRVDQSHLIQAVQRARATKVQSGRSRNGLHPHGSSSPWFQQGRSSRQDRDPPLIWFPPEDN